MTIDDYYYESDGPIERKKPKKRNRERVYTRKFVNQMSQQGARATRYPDDSNLHMPYDGHVYYARQFVPFECKFKDEGKTFSVAGWRKRQPHQFNALMADYNRGAKALLIVFWKVGGRVQTRAKGINDLGTSGKVALESMALVRDLSDLMKV